MELILWLPLIFQEAVAQEGGSVPSAREQETSPAPIEAAPARIKKEKKKKKRSQDAPQEERQSQEESPYAERLKSGTKLRHSQDYLWNTKLGLQFEYNDNILRLDKRDIEAFQNGSKPDKFRIRSIDDFITSPLVEEDLTFWLFDQRATAGLDFVPHFFETNSFMDYEDISAFLKSKTYELRFLVEPHVYRREHRNLDTGLFQSAFYSDFDVEGSLKIHPTDYLQLRPKVDLEYRAYDAPFEFYDTVYLGFSPRATALLTPWLHAFLEYRLVYAQSFATDLQPDDSYLENGIEPGVTVKATKELEVSLRYYFGRREYTTSNDPFIDPNHAGRVDLREHVKLKAEWKIWPNLLVNAEYYYADVRTNKPFRPDITEDEWNWVRNIVTIGVSYQF